MDNRENAFNKAYDNVLKYTGKSIYNINIEEFNNAYSNFEETFTPEEKIQILFKNIELNVQKKNYDLVIKAYDKIIEINNNNRLTQNF